MRSISIRCWANALETNNNGNKQMYAAFILRSFLPGGLPITHFLWLVEELTPSSPASPTSPTTTGGNAGLERRTLLMSTWKVDGQSGGFAATKLPVRPLRDGLSLQLDVGGGGDGCEGDENVSFDLVRLNFGRAQPNSNEGRHVETSVILSVGVSVSMYMSQFWLGSVFLTLSVFASFYTHTRTHILIPLASCASGGMM